MNRCAVFGLGKMGECIAWSMKQLGYEVYGIDIDKDKCSNALNQNYCDKINWDIESAKKEILDVDIIISALPYHQNYEIAHFAISKGIKYCDLGGSVPISQRINDLAKTHAKQPVFTDIGLAPGLVNIIACDAIRQLGEGNIENLEMSVGGIPIRGDNILNYGITWSLDGLLNEYRDECIVLEDGQEKKIPALRDVYNVEVYIDKHLQLFEGSPTSGAMAHSIEWFKSCGVKNAKYLTLRYPQHFGLIKWMMETLKLDNDTIKDYIEKTCPKDPIDAVVLEVYSDSVELHYNKTLTFFHDDFINLDNLSLSFEVYKYIDANAKKGFSAMQKATGFTAATIADMMVKKLILCNKTCSYELVNLNILLNKLEFLKNESTKSN